MLGAIFSRVQRYNKVRLQFLAKTSYDPEKRKNLTLVYGNSEAYTNWPLIVGCTVEGIFQKQSCMGDDICTFLWELGPLYLLILASYLFQVSVAVIELSI